jgi:hypothetical protein
MPTVSHASIADLAEVFVFPEDPNRIPTGDPFPCEYIQVKCVDVFDHNEVHIGVGPAKGDPNRLLELTHRIELILDPDDAVKLMKRLRVAIVMAKVNKSGGHFAHLANEVESQILADCSSITAEAAEC